MRVVELALVLMLITASSAAAQAVRGVAIVNVSLRIVNSTSPAVTLADSTGVAALAAPGADVTLHGEAPFLVQASMPSTHAVSWWAESRKGRSVQVPVTRLEKRLAGEADQRLVIAITTL